MVIGDNFILLPTTDSFQCVTSYRKYRHQFDTVYRIDFDPPLALANTTMKPMMGRLSPSILDTMSSLTVFSFAKSDAILLVNVCMFMLLV